MPEQYDNRAYNDQLNYIRGIFGKEQPPKKGRLFTKIKKVGPRYLPMVKIGFFSKWKRVGWVFYDEQSGLGYTKARADIKCSSPTDLIGAIELIENFKKYRGAGITIW